MNLSLEGKYAIVCGSTQGIGLAIAEELALLGASCTLVARNEEALRAAVHTLDIALRQKHNWLVADFSKPDEVASVIQKHVADNPVHILVNNTGGPNARKDYHYNESEELYYQVEGNIVLKIIDNGVPRSIPINEGDMFLLPPKTPHSPQRGANTVGLVIEKIREDEEEEKDAFMWFCENCGNKLHEEVLFVKDIVSQLPPVMNKFWGSIELRTCKKCGTVMEPPKKA